jgi:RND family efflux transporter MFP subunit
LITNIIKKGFILCFIQLLFTVNLSATPFEISGFIVSNNQQIISTKYNGYVEKIFVNEGDIVNIGDKLLQIDLKENTSLKSQTKIAMQQAQLTYAMNKSDLEKATLDYKRYQSLLEKNAVSKMNFEEIQLKKENLEKVVEISKQHIAQYEEQLKEIEKQFQYLNIKATSKALIISKNINEGELAVASKPLLVICDIENLVIYLDVSESDLKHFRDQPNIDIVIESLNLTLKAKTATILPAVNNAMNNFRVKLSFESTDKRILPGMYVKVIVK